MIFGSLLSPHAGDHLQHGRALLALNTSIFRKSRTSYSRRMSPFTFLVKSSSWSHRTKRRLRTESDEHAPRGDTGRYAKPRVSKGGARRPTNPTSDVCRTFVDGKILHHSPCFRTKSIAHHLHDGLSVDGNCYSVRLQRMRGSFVSVHPRCWSLKGAPCVHFAAPPQRRAT